MKDYKLVNSGKNGNLYYAMSSALDGLKGLLEFADRIYVIDQGKNLIWTGSELVEDKNPENEESSGDGSGGSGTTIILNLSFDETLQQEVVTCDKTFSEIAEGFDETTNFVLKSQIIVDNLGSGSVDYYSYVRAQGYIESGSVTEITLTFMSYSVGFDGPGSITVKKVILSANNFSVGTYDVISG